MKMQRIEFIYTKPDGKVSERDLLVLSAPNTYYKGLDMSELEEEDKYAFLTEYRELQEKHRKEAQALQAKHDLKYAFRQFIPDRMSEIVTLEKN